MTVVADGTIGLCVSLDRHEVLLCVTSSNWWPGNVIFLSWLGFAVLGLCVLELCRLLPLVWAATP